MLGILKVCKAMLDEMATLHIERKSGIPADRYARVMSGRESIFRFLLGCDNRCSTLYKEILPMKRDSSRDVIIYFQELRIFGICASANLDALAADLGDIAAAYSNEQMALSATLWRVQPENEVCHLAITCSDEAAMDDIVDCLHASGFGNRMGRKWISENEVILEFRDADANVAEMRAHFARIMDYMTYRDLEASRTMHEPQLINAGNGLHYATHILARLPREVIVLPNEPIVAESSEIKDID